MRALTGLSESEIEKRVTAARRSAWVMVWFMRVFFILYAPVTVPLIILFAIYEKVRGGPLRDWPKTKAYYNTEKVQRGIEMVERRARRKYWWED